MLHISDNVTLMACYVVKFRGAAHLSAKVLVAYTLHFKPILTPIKNC